MLNEGSRRKRNRLLFNKQSLYVNIIDLIKYIQSLLKNSKFKVISEGKTKKKEKGESIKKTNILTR